MVAARIVRTAAMGFLTFLCAVAALAAGAVTRSERIPSRVMAWWGRALVRTAGCRVRVEGAGRLPEAGAVLVANHQSYLDIPLLLAALGGRVKFVAKRELGKIPLFGPAMVRAGNLLVDRDDPREAVSAVREAVERIGRGERIVVFPEGTRSADGTIGAFRPGAFFIARRAGAPLVPVRIDGSARAMPRGTLLVCPAEMSVLVLPPVSPESGSREELAEEARRRIVSAGGAAREAAGRRL